VDMAYFKEKKPAPKRDKWKPPLLRLRDGVFWGRAVENCDSSNWHPPSGASVGTGSAFSTSHLEHGKGDALAKAYDATKKSLPVIQPVGKAKNRNQL
jgi:hypothetical protein